MRHGRWAALVVAVALIMVVGVAVRVKAPTDKAAVAEGGDRTHVAAFPDGTVVAVRAPGWLRLDQVTVSPFMVLSLRFAGGGVIGGVTRIAPGGATCDGCVAAPHWREGELVIPAGFWTVTFRPDPSAARAMTEAQRLAAAEGVRGRTIFRRFVVLQVDPPVRLGGAGEAGVAPSLLWGDLSLQLGCGGFPSRGTAEPADPGVFAWCDEASRIGVTFTGDPRKAADLKVRLGLELRGKGSGRKA